LSCVAEWRARTYAIIAMKISIYSETYLTTSLRNIVQKYLTAMLYYVYHIQCQSAVLYQKYQTLLLVKIKPIVSLVKESERVDNGISSA
jgi:hypothetical protein